ncbi:lactonase family protein [Robertkochia flava]|uniref:lactonase family protein n=1 Tax=Robertkochia flava TaxID=3447986 RepID=UPI001CCCF282|nr:lactonase family protein [Robertkochia marina]
MQNSGGDHPDIPTEFYIGTYSKNNSKGIYKAAITPEGKFKELRALMNVKDPSYLAKAKEGNFLLAVSEQEIGSLRAFMINGDSLQQVSLAEEIGTHPCHISIDKNRNIAVSNYSSGTVAMFRMNDEGNLTSMGSLEFKGNGPHPRQEAPHAHSSYFLDDNHLITADLGTDKLWISRVNNGESGQNPEISDSIVLAPGSGPRHMAFHSNQKWIYLVNELSATVNLIKMDTTGTAFSVAQEISTLPDSYTGENLCADIHLDRSGNFLYVSNRGHQTLAIYRVDQQNGRLSLVGFESVRGDWPRNFNITPDNKYLIVANERSDNLVCFKRDTLSGNLIYTDQVQVPAPVCITF